MTQEIKALFGVGIVTIILVVGAVLFFGNSQQNTSGQQASNKDLLIRDNSNKTTEKLTKVTLVEFSDFQCPACKAAHPLVKQLLGDYKENITFVYRHFPLPQHKNALIAAKAAEAAGEQKKFWDMHNMLFDKQLEWSESNNASDMFVDYAKNLNLDTDRFKQDLQSDKYTSKIQNDQNDGQQLGVNSTPTFFLNGEKIVGVPNIGDIKNKIDSSLNKK